MPLLNKNLQIVDAHKYGLIVWSMIFKKVVNKKIYINGQKKCYFEEKGFLRHILNIFYILM